MLHTQCAEIHHNPTRNTEDASVFSLSVENFVCPIKLSKIPQDRSSAISNEHLTLTHTDQVVEMKSSSESESEQT